MIKEIDDRYVMHVVTYRPYSQVLEKGLCLFFPHIFGIAKGKGKIKGILIMYKLSP